MSKSITFLGAETAGVRLNDPEVVFEHGVPVDVDDDVAARLLDEYPGTFSTSDQPQLAASKAAWEAFRAAQGHDMSVERTKQELIDLPDTPAKTQES